MRIHRIPHTIYDIYGQQKRKKTRKSVRGQARVAQKAPRLYSGKNDGRAPPDPPLCTRPWFLRMKTTQLPWRPGETVLSLEAINLKNNGLCNAGVGLCVRMSRIIQPHLPVAVFGACAILLRLYTSTERLKRLYTSSESLLETCYLEEVIVLIIIYNFYVNSFPLKFT